VNIAPRGASILPIGVNINPAVILVNPQGAAIWVSILSSAGMRPPACVASMLLKLRAYR
jgi:hypothetical protein